ncbi:ATP synthase F1 subcomplex delta subunit [Sinobaca qinghaiensis]|uniref:ATP synthase subunit delta n=1 Tax=Sinobaca qinghaiensis TaxID=342944 RepID=A0A419V840_9BACL|nr:F0F1 ATP synthase subunit delta [Sinobaca qinghaiensis]RKD76089.1 ATP synthase F1 subcomplex delta subunit [Sinobaca qinghaiensis]
MSNPAAARRYAVALFELAGEKGMLEEINNELQVVKETFVQNPAYVDFLENPKVTQDKKAASIHEVFLSTNDMIRSTLLLLLKKRRIDCTVLIAEQYEKLADDQQKRGYAKVYTVKPLNEQEKTRISEVFAKRVGKDTVFIENIIDSSLIGGMKIRIGDTIFDGSVRNQLNRLEHQLISGKDLR